MTGYIRRAIGFCLGTQVPRTHYTLNKKKRSGSVCSVLGCVRSQVSKVPKAVVITKRDNAETVIGVPPQLFVEGPGVL